MISEKESITMKSIEVCTIKDLPDNAAHVFDENFYIDEKGLIFKQDDKFYFYYLDWFEVVMWRDNFWSESCDFSQSDLDELKEFVINRNKKNEVKQEPEEQITIKPLTLENMIETLTIQDWNGFTVSMKHKVLDYMLLKQELHNT